MSLPKLLVLGGSGQLGQALQDHKSAASYSIEAPSSKVVDIRDAVRLLAFVRESAPRFVVNCAAHTAVDRAESESDLAYAINATGAGNVACACAASDARLIHVSTDFVFSGEANRPYRETDVPAPINVYGASKLQGEHRVAEELPDSCILRVSWLFGHSSSSFVAKILTRAQRGETLRVVDDQFGCPTSADGAADAVFALIESPRWQSGVRHYCGSPSTTWFGFAEAIVREAAALGLLTAPVSVARIRSSELGAPARRPAYSVLDAGLLTSQAGIEADAWQKRVRRVLELIARPGSI